MFLQCYDKSQQSKFRHTIDSSSTTVNPGLAIVHSPGRHCFQDQPWLLYCYTHSLTHRKAVRPALHLFYFIAAPQSVFIIVMTNTLYIHAFTQYHCVGFHFSYNACSFSIHFSHEGLFPGITVFTYHRWSVLLHVTDNNVFVCAVCGHKYMELCESWSICIAHIHAREVCKIIIEQRHGWVNVSQ